MERDLADARWFAVDLHVPDRRFGFLPLDDGLIERAAFLDTRLPAPLADATQVPVATIAAAQLPRATVGWLFHTSFCASTLLARALHLPPFAVALKEPLVLRRLADARKSAWSVDGIVAPAAALLARPWHADGAVVVKPTHVALNVAAALLEATPGSRAIVLTGPLDDFLISNLKNSAESQAKIPVLVERALKATTFATRLPAAALHPPDLVCAAGLQWAAQRELVLEVVAAIGPARIRVLEMAPLLADLAGTTWDVAQWLQLPAPRAAIVANAARVATHHAKALDVAFSADHRARETAIVVARHGVELARARAWLDANVLPAMR